jgi:hypothetical protein
MIECRDCGDDTDRLANRECPAAVTGGSNPHRDFPPSAVAQNLDSVAYSVDGTVCLDDGVRQRLATFAGDLTAEMVASAIHELCQFAKYLDSLVWLEPGITMSKGRRGRIELAFE